MKSQSFINEFLKSPVKVGSVIQSSKILARTMAHQINGSLDVVEFGAGMGSVTEHILRRLPPNGRLICFEINSKFCEHLMTIDDPRLTVINDGAENCHKYVGRLECVVSGLPLALFSKTKRQEILDISSKSRRFIQFQYSLVLKDTIKEHFSDVRIKFVPLNFPPAFVFVCTSSGKQTS
ncbi:MAG: hypothetical protein JXB29_04180 [Sedimentisphaerales bacterium]|nr:hypothetical protein [Sedimentisphaerales bacterium]